MLGNEKAAEDFLTSNEIPITLVPENNMADASQKFWKEIRETYLTCKICEELFNQQDRLPRMLPCQHTFCGTCIARLDEGGELSCPNCRQNIRMAGTFPVETMRSILLDCTEVIQTAQEALCEGCDDGTKATSHCLDCTQNFCDRCCIYHTKFKATRDHVIVSLEEAARSPSLLTQKVEMCQKHRGESVKVYCLVCKTAVCSTCAITLHLHKDHEGQSMVELQDVLEQVKTEIERLCVAYENIQNSSLQPRAKMAATSLQETDASFQNAARRLQRGFHGLNTAIHYRLEQVMEELRSKWKADRMEVEEQAAVAESYVDAAKTCTALSRTVASAGLPNHILAQRQELERAVQEARAEGGKPLLSSMQYKVNFSMSVMMDVLPQLCNIVSSRRQQTSKSSTLPAPPASAMTSRRRPAPIVERKPEPRGYWRTLQQEGPRGTARPEPRGHWTPQQHERPGRPERPEPQEHWRSQQQERPREPETPETQGQRRAQQQDRPRGPERPDPQGHWRQQQQERPRGPERPDPQGHWRQQQHERPREPERPEPRSYWRPQQQERPRGPERPEQQGHWRPQQQERPRLPERPEKRGDSRPQQQERPREPERPGPRGYWEPQQERPRGPERPESRGKGRPLQRDKPSKPVTLPSQSAPTSSSVTSHIIQTPEFHLEPDWCNAGCTLEEDGRTLTNTPRPQSGGTGQPGLRPFAFPGTCGSVDLAQPALHYWTVKCSGYGIGASCEVGLASLWSLYNCRIGERISDHDIQAPTVVMVVEDDRCRLEGRGWTKTMDTPLPPVTRDTPYTSLESCGCHGYCMTLGFLYDNRQPQSPRVLVVEAESCRLLGVRRLSPSPVLRPVVRVEAPSHVIHTRVKMELRAGPEVLNDVTANRLLCLLDRVK